MTIIRTYDPMEIDPPCHKYLGQYTKIIRAKPNYALILFHKYFKWNNQINGHINSKLFPGTYYAPVNEGIPRTRGDHPFNAGAIPALHHM